MSGPRRNRYPRKGWLAPALAASSAAAVLACCNALWGVDDLRYGPQAGVGASGGGAAGGAAASGGAGGGAGHGGVTTATLSTGGSTTTAEGGAGGKGEVDPCAPPVGPACASYAAAYCGLAMQCAPWATTVFAGGEAHCTEITGQSCARRVAVPDSAATESYYANCGQVLLTADCAIFYTQTPPDACLIPPGPRALTEPCTVNGQCASGFCDAENGNGGCGRCRMLPGIDDLCNGSCEPGLGCLDGYCRPWRSLHDSCSGTRPCAADLTCVDSQCESAGTHSADCGMLFPPCSWALGLFCNEQNHCAYRTALPPSLPCNGETDLCVGGACRDGECVDRADACSPCGDGELCDPGSQCEAGICEPYRIAECD